MKFFSLWEKVPVRADGEVMDKDSSLALKPFVKIRSFHDGYSEVVNLIFQFSHQNHTKKSFQ